MINILKSKVVIIISIFIFILLFVFIYWAMESNKNQFGYGINIQGYDQKVPNLPKEMKDSTETRLYDTLKQNGASDEILKNTKDAKIRDKSENQNYSDTSKLYTGRFIVDIESLKQSYEITYLYSINKIVIAVPDRSVLINCLPNNQIIYGEFSCRDEITDQRIESMPDTVLKYLPRSTSHYEMRAATNSDMKVDYITIKLNLYESDYRTGVDTSIAKYKQEALDYLKSVGINPSDYKIEYSY